MKIESTKEIHTTINPEGEETSTTIERTRKIERLDEPDYIKIYTSMWFLFNQIPSTYKELFLEFATNMSYCNAHNLEESQIVCTSGPIKKSILKKLNIKDRQYQRGIAELCKCGALKRIQRGFYQINPSYAGKGEWKYNPRLARGGIEQLVAIFKLEKNGEKTSELSVIWSDTGSNEEIDKDMRKEFGKNAVVTEQVISSNLQKLDQSSHELAS